MKSIYKTFLSLASIAAITAGCAQAGEPTTLSDSDQKGVPAGWVTDYDAALKQAKAEGKDVMIDFTGSDWCGWCIKLHDEILDKEAFKEYAKENLVLVYLDYPRGKPQTEALKEQNEKLSEKYGIRGFPTLVILNSDGKKIGQMGYQKGGPKPFVEALEKVTKKS
ncbi:thioredoxin family protein [Rubellicoccus peritrichatus]|uniref:Thioredoxin family protein n=1 Tax=Rubellicoccus peritrichatus TaxID=3080537 RepID=A0AAQ3LIM0_9BACT|nr:thioredoxin family protein [Puniceicoccus sp. CR14]WOO42814.1 thioredoxin family protein [Puniceicoccus sp. CR14]